MNTTPKKGASKHADAVSVAPVGISKLNCESLLGVSPRQLRDLGRRFKLPRLPGKIPVFQAEAVLALFASTDEPEVLHVAAEDEPTSVADVLSRIGKRMGGAR